MTSCTVCQQDFIPSFNALQRVCSVKCAQRITTINRRAELAEKAAHKRKLAELKTRGQWLREAQTAFNAYIRARDAELPCVSCGRFHTGSYDAGHFRTVGSAPELRFDEANCHRQCVPCNQHKHGNVLAYRAGLIARLGPAVVDRLEGPQTLRKYTIDDAKAIRDEYRSKLKALGGPGTQAGEGVRSPHNQGAKS